MKKINLKTKPYCYFVKFMLKNKHTKLEEDREEFVYSFSTEDNLRVSKEIENKYRGQGYKVTILSVTERTQNVTASTVEPT